MYLAATDTPNKKLEQAACRSKAKALVAPICEAT